MMSISEYYLFWLIPSIISFTLSGCMALNILLVPDLRTRIYQQLLAVLAVTDLIKCGSWFISGKYTAPYNYCAVQEYLFQFGMLAQALCTVLICGVALFTVTYRQVPSKPRLIIGITILLVILVIGSAVNIAFKSATLFCQHEYNGFYEKEKQTELYVYTFGNLLPVISSIVINIVTFFLINKRFRKLNVLFDLATSEDPLHVLVYRLRAYPVIFILCYSPFLLIYATATVTGTFTLPLAALASIFVSCLGAVLAVNYFYYQRTLAPFMACIFSLFRPLQAAAVALVSDDQTTQHCPDRDASRDKLLMSVDSEQVITRYFPSIDGSDSKTYATEKTPTSMLLTIE